ncbi:YqcI/YcgG family protein [Terribacillus saccharophilus]|uniref:YqcI/YcgG family protein n=1 Tax=Terribacillus saccharophilus TaxID=361277 RepID=UPI003981DC23
MTILFDDTNTETAITASWQKEALLAFHSKLLHQQDRFPCIPATAGHRLGQFRYSFAGDPTTKEAAVQLAESLRIYGQQSKEIGSYTSLIVFFDTEKQKEDNLDVPAYFRIFWDLLSGTTAYDPVNWPSDIPQNPDDALWEYCFGGEKYFMYCATPAHQQKKSRYFPCLMLAITPRWVLKKFESKPKAAAGIKQNIRKRILAYDTSDIHPDLNAYGNHDNHEWKQYFLHDDNSSPTACPFHRKKKD